MSVTKVILTDVSPQNARTLVRLSVDLSNIASKSSHNAGLKLALARNENEE